MFAKASSSVESQTKSVNFTMYDLVKDQSANCSVHTGQISDSQDSSSSKTIAPPSVSVTVSTVPPSASKTIAPRSSQHLSVNTAASVSKT